MNVKRKKATPSDREFARVSHHLAYHDVVVQQFGAWDEKLQDGFFAAAWDLEKMEIVLLDDLPAGFLMVEDGSDSVFIKEIVIRPEFQGKGIGRQILSDEIDRAFSHRKTVKLRVLKENRARTLYLRLGFKEYDRTETHVLMERRK